MRKIGPEREKKIGSQALNVCYQLRGTGEKGLEECTGKIARRKRD